MSIILAVSDNDILLSPLPVGLVCSVDLIAGYFTVPDNLSLYFESKSGALYYFSC